MNKIIRKIVIVLLVLIVSICGRLFVTDIFKIPSISMENTLFPDDIILVNKLSYGPKTPSSISEIPWINLFFSFSKKETWNSQRLSGLRNIQQGDVLVFQRPNSKFAVKRCVGIAGDQFELIHGNIVTNSQEHPPSSTVKKAYEVEVTNSELFFNELSSLKTNAEIYPLPKVKTRFEVHMTIIDYNKIKKLSSVKSIETHSENRKYKKLFIQENSLKWNLDNLGVFTIPKKGFAIELNDLNFNIYQTTLQEYEKVPIIKEGNLFLLNGQRVTHHTFQKDYIFVMGDNRKNSEDSRYYGFIPVENVVGKVQCVLYSNYNNQFHWDRLFKGVHEN